MFLPEHRNMQSFNLLQENKAVTNYYYFAKLFTNEEIDKIMALSKKYTPVEGNVSGVVDRTYRNSKIVWLPISSETQFLYDRVIDLMKNANSNMWKFHITTIKDSIQVSEYTGSTNPDESGHYDWHMDVGENASTRKISMSIQLSDDTDYDGGNLEFMVHRSIIKAPREKGTVIFFPSYLTHRVTKVTRGTRNSLVFWFHGPPFV